MSASKRIFVCGIRTVNSAGELSITMAPSSRPYVASNSGTSDHQSVGWPIAMDWPFLHATPEFATKNAHQSS